MIANGRNRMRHGQINLTGQSGQERSSASVLYRRQTCMAREGVIIESILWPVERTREAINQCNAFAPIATSKVKTIIKAQGFDATVHSP